jgi:hypothetical protein
MKIIFFLLAAVLTVLPLPAQTADDRSGTFVQDNDRSYTPLLLLTNGNGRVFPFRDGQLLETGRTYVMAAVPDRGFAFSSWQPVVVFTFSEYAHGPSGTLIERTTEDVVPTPEYTWDRALKFTMQPEQVILDIPNVRIITQSFGWQANFVPVTQRNR